MKVLFIILALALTGCATGRVEYYAAEQSRHATEKARWEAMGRIAESGDVTAKAVALAVMGGQGGSQSQATAAPVNEALQWAQVLVPGLTQMVGIAANARVATVQSNNGAAVAQSTNSTFSGIAGKIQAPGSVTTTSTDRHDVLTTTSTDRHDIVTSTPFVVPTVITPIVQIVPTVITPIVQITPIARTP